MQNDDLDTALTGLRQELSDTLFVIGVIIDIRRAADRLRPPLADELRTIRTAIDQLLPLL
jgi:hypothetical protein